MQFSDVTCMEIELSTRCNAKCPHWSKNDNYPRRENGYCAFLGKGDWELDHIGLLWDQVKECGINCSDGPGKYQLPEEHKGN